ncbi:uncharacterized protein LOC110055123 isoform X2 [Orbicella faveolata]|uniref:uncharacterized protein LOC110055123 isoform X2 n=1 Tax=Orbicella faveolata TaxID=48498 RepID=UPI0009E217BD|nr:uncharacterized protein LOC110055123 isoform X2 [Orbicella faveolata]
MPDSDNPRSYVRPVPLPIPSHQGLKITARNAKMYTCEVPARREVARENYERRRHQMSKCGYRSVIYKPYQPVGEVYLDDKKLILNALGQEQTEQDDQIQDESSSSSGESESEDEESLRQSKDQQPVVPQPTNYKPKVINDIKAQVNKGRKMIHAVRLGFGLYRLVQEEQNRKQAEAEKERKRKEEDAKNQMKPASTDSEDSDDELDIELKSYMIPVSTSPTREIESGFGEHLDPQQTQQRPGSAHSSASSQRWKRLSTTVSAAFRNPQTPQPQVQVSSPSPSPSTELDIDRSSTAEQPGMDHVMANAPSNPTLAPRRYLHPPKSAAHSTVSKSSRRSRKLKSPRPYSPVYSNINYNDVADRKNVFRQLCALNWILEGMSQDQQPPVMPPITSCWKLKDLNEDPRTIRKRVEKDRATDKDWVTFKQNPARFTQRGTRRGTRRISIHPNFIQRFSTTGSGGQTPTVGPNVLRVPSDSRPRSGTSNTAETVASTRTEIQTEHAHADQVIPQEDSVSQTQGNSPRDGPTVSFVDPKIRAVSAPPGPVGNQTAVAAGALPVTMSGTTLNGALQNGTPGGAEKKTPSKLQKQKSFTVTTVYTPPSNPSKAMQKIRAKTKAANAFKTSLSHKELEKLASKPEEQQTASDSRVRAWVQATGAVNTKRFAAAAIAAFGAISLDHRAEKVPGDLKTKFNEVADEKALVLHDNLEVRDRSRLQVLERKLMCLETFNNIYKALDQMRSSSVVPETETNEEMRQRVTKECKWYKDLLSNLPQEVKADRYCTIVLNRIASYGSLEGRKISSSQFLKVLSTLRVWEICAPDINAAIEFVREKIVEMSELEFEDWMNAKFPQPQRPVSAPPPRSNGFRY